MHEPNSIDSLNNKNVAVILVALSWLSVDVNPLSLDTSTGWCVSSSMLRL